MIVFDEKHNKTERARGAAKSGGTHSKLCGIIIRTKKTKRKEEKPELGEDSQFEQ